jgi:hypothetical protein
MTAEAEPKSMQSHRGPNNSPAVGDRTTTHDSAEPAASAGDVPPAAIGSFHPAHFDPRALTHGQVLALQRTIGDRAVVRLLAGHPGPRAAVAGGLQRQPRAGLLREATELEGAAKVGVPGGLPLAAPAQDLEPITLPRGVQDAVELVSKHLHTLDELRRWLEEMSEFLAARGQPSWPKVTFGEEPTRMRDPAADWRGKRPWVPAVHEHLAEHLGTHARELHDVYSKLWRGTRGLVDGGPGPFPYESVARFAIALERLAELDAVAKLYDLWHWLNDLKHDPNWHPYAFKRSLWGQGATLTPKVFELAQALARSFSMARSAE